jgi:hypothetical protein
MEMICDNGDPSTFTNRLKFIAEFGGAKLGQFDNPYFGVCEIQLEAFVNGMFPTTKVASTVHDPSLNPCLHASTLGCEKSFNSVDDSHSSLDQSLGTVRVDDFPAHVQGPARGPPGSNITSQTISSVIHNACTGIQGTLSQALTLL